MTDQQPHPDGSPWLRIGALANDSAADRCGIVQLLQDELGTLCSDVIDHPTRAVLRPVQSGEISEQPWWAAVKDLRRVNGE